MQRRHFLSSALLAAQSAWGQGRGDTSPFSTPGARRFVAGNEADVEKKSKGGMVLLGGGELDEAAKWLIDRSGGGDLVVLRTAGGAASNAQFTRLGGVDSVETLELSQRVATSDPAAVARFRTGEAIWIADGNQADYVRVWRDTGISHQLTLAGKRGVAVGGVGGGMSILGEYSFSMEAGAIEAAQALVNPFDDKIRLTRNFLALPFMNGVITDPQFRQKDRMGRLIVFLCRILEYGWERTAKGIGLDEKTAVLVDERGKGRVIGEGSAYFVRTILKADVLEPTVALTLRSGVDVKRVKAGGAFDLKDWGGESADYKIMVERGKLDSRQAGGAAY